MIPSPTTVIAVCDLCALNFFLGAFIGLTLATIVRWMFKR